MTKIIFATLFVNYIVGIGTIVKYSGVVTDRQFGVCIQIVVK